MKRIGVISDTHGTFDDVLKHFLEDVDEIWPVSYTHLTLPTIA